MEHYKNLSLELLTCYDPDGNFHVEEFKDIEGYENYQISTFGRVKRLAHKYRKIEIIKKPVKGKSGYLSVSLSNNKIDGNKRINRLVALAFIPNPENKSDVNHIDLIKTNNCVWNLEWNTNRENIHHYQLTKRKTIGITKSSSGKKWRTFIQLNKKKIHLGIYETETEAQSAYQRAIVELHETGKITPYINDTFSSTLKYVSWHKDRKKWRGSFTYNKQSYHVGTFNTEIEAFEASKNKRKELGLD